MACRTFRLCDGTTAIVCTRDRRRSRCYLCDAMADYQCDARKGRGCCNRYLCARHRVPQGLGVDFCPEHAGGVRQLRLAL
jgi:hypothetical protein